MRRVFLVASAILLWLRAAAGGEDVVENPAPLGCYAFGYRFTPQLEEEPRNASGPEDCQRQCSRHEACKVFGYFEGGACFFGGDDAQLVPANPSAVAGPTRCSSPPAPCTVNLSARFPGNLAQDTRSLFAGAFMPPKLQCWPLENREPVDCSDEPLMIMDDVASGWPGQCTGLQRIVLPPNVTCEESCRANVSCPVWQQIDSDPTQCWQGVGYNCEGSRAGLEVVAAQRLMRGHFRVLMDLAGVQVMNLQRIFLESPADIEEAKSRCRNACLSLVSCEVWQLSSRSGCWVEDTTKRAIDYPPTTSSFTRGSESAHRVMAGEYLQRLCGPFPGIKYQPQLGSSNSTSTLAPNTTTAFLSTSYVGPSSSAGKGWIVSQDEQTTTTATTTTTSSTGTTGRNYLWWIVGVAAAFVCLCLAIIGPSSPCKEKAPASRAAPLAASECPDVDAAVELRHAAATRYDLDSPFSTVAAETRPSRPSRLPQKTAHFGLGSLGHGISELATSAHSPYSSSYTALSSSGSPAGEREYQRQPRMLPGQSLPQTLPALAPALPGAHVSVANLRKPGAATLTRGPVPQVMSQLPSTRQLVPPYRPA